MATCPVRSSKSSSTPRTVSLRRTRPGCRVPTRRSGNWIPGYLSAGWCSTSSSNARTGCKTLGSCLSLSWAPPTWPERGLEVGQDTELVPRQATFALCPSAVQSRALWGHSTPFFCYSGCLGSLGEDALGAATTIVNAKVFDGTKSQDWTSVRFADGLVTTCSAASAAQEGDEVIDAGGGTVLPGLI